MAERLRQLSLKQRQVGSTPTRPAKFGDIMEQDIEDDLWESPCYIGGGSLGDECVAEPEPTPPKTYQDYLIVFEVLI